MATKRSTSVSSRSVSTQNSIDSSSLTKKSDQFAQALLDAHVQHWLSKLTGKEPSHHVLLFVDFFLDTHQKITLNNAVTPQAIKDVIRIYAFELNLGGGIIELVGEIMQRIVEALQKNPTTLAEMMSDDHVAQWIAKLTELDQFYLTIFSSMLQNKQLPYLLARLVSALAVQQKPEWLQFLSHHNVSAKEKSFAARAGQRLQQVVRRRAQQALSVAEEGLADLLVLAFKQLQAKLLIDKPSTIINRDDLEDLLMRVWLSTKHESLSKFMTGLDAVDFTEFFVLVYETWRGYRQTTPLRDIVYSAVDVLFDMYGDESLVDLLEDTGVTRAHLNNEAIRFVPRYLNALHHVNALEPLIRNLLSDFYKEEKTLALIEQVIR